MSATDVSIKLEKALKAIRASRMELVLGANRAEEAHRIVLSIDSMAPDITNALTRLVGITQEIDSLLEELGAADIDIRNYKERLL